MNEKKNDVIIQHEHTIQHIIRILLFENKSLIGWDNFQYTTLPYKPKHIPKRIHPIYNKLSVNNYTKWKSNKFLQSADID